MNYGNFGARTSRSGYWLAALFVGLSGIVTNLVDILVLPSIGIGQDVFGGLGPLSTLYASITVTPSLALMWRRMNDVGHSGWWAVAPFAFGIGAYLALSGIFRVRWGEVLGLFLFAMAAVTLVVFVVFSLFPSRYGKRSPTNALLISISAGAALSLLAALAFGLPNIVRFGDEGFSSESFGESDHSRTQGSQGSDLPNAGSKPAGDFSVEIYYMGEEGLDPIHCIRDKLFCAYGLQFTNITDAPRYIPGGSLCVRLDEGHFDLRARVEPPDAYINPGRSGVLISDFFVVAGLQPERIHEYYYGLCGEPESAIAWFPGSAIKVAPYPEDWE